MTQADSVDTSPNPQPRIQTLTLDHPWSWLAEGWQDLQATPVASLGYGLMFVVAGYLLIGVTVVADMFFLFFPLVSGFLLVGPLVAVGLYEMSRRRELELPVTFMDAFRAWHANGTQIAAFGVILMLIFLAWMQLSMLVFVLMFDGLTPTWDNFMQRVFLSADSFPLLVVMISLGAVLACAVFAISALAVPMLLDRTTNAFDAMRASVLAVRHNIRPMVLWAALIVGITVLGLATFLVGLSSRQIWCLDIDPAAT